MRAFRRDLLEAFLYEASSEGKREIPTKEVLIFSGLVKGIAEYLGEYLDKEVGMFVTPHPRDRILGINPPRERRLQRFYQWSVASAEVKGQELGPRIREAVDKLVDLEWRHASVPYVSGYPHMELYDCFKGDYSPGICRIIRKQDFFQLDRRTCQRIREDVLPGLSPEERKDVQGIGKLMGRYLLGDFIYWKASSGKFKNK